MKNVLPIFSSKTNPTISFQNLYFINYLLHFQPGPGSLPLAHKHTQVYINNEPFHLKRVTSKLLGPFYLSFTPQCGILHASPLLKSVFTNDLVTKFKCYFSVLTQSLYTDYSFVKNLN